MTIPFGMRWRADIANSSNYNSNNDSSSSSGGGRGIS
jgi:hypothetical protein